MDKYRIDSHKYAFHPEHAGKVIAYNTDPCDENITKAYKEQHPVYIEVSPVGACNHRCTFCAVDYIGYKSVFMNVKSFETSIRGMKGKGCKSIMFAGEGEPLLHPEIKQIISITKNIGGIDVAFTTNAVRLDKELVKSSLRDISWIKVSFNGGTAKVYSEIHRTKEKDFEIVSNNIQYAVSHRKQEGLECAIGLQTLLLPDNADSMHEMCRHAKELGVDYVVVKPYSQHKFSETKKYEKIDYNDYLSLKSELEAYNDDDFQVVFRANTINNWISQNNNRYCKCLATPAAWSYWMADGDVYSCSAYLLDERFKLGNINEYTFADIWESDYRLKHADFIRNELDINECRVNCRMDQVNRYLDSILNSSIDHINFI